MGRTANSIRWREGQKEKLAKIAKHCGVEVVDLIRNAADAVIQYADAHNGVVPFPLNFEVGFTPHRRRLALPDPVHELESVRQEDPDKIRKSARSRAAEG